MKRRIDLPELTRWITPAALTEGERLPELLMQRLSIGRRSARALLARLVALQWLEREGTPRKPAFRPGALRQVVRSYPIEGLQEDLPWQRDFAPAFAAPAPVMRMAQHAFVELLNNAIDHSGGGSVTVSMRQTATQMQLLVSDDGCGVFARIREAFAIDDDALAMLELAKGKLTSQPQCHSGHGLYFTARLADVFDLQANRQAYRFCGWGPRRWHAIKPMQRAGTTAYVAIALETARTLDGVLRAHSTDGTTPAFEVTQVPLHLIVAEHVGLESRAQAVRVASRLERFRRVELDFSDVDAIGHGFADQLFRVVAGEHLGLQLLPLHANPGVASMIDSVRAAHA